jgi:TfoX/Sxy family transcriptional regulator of competence genes
MKKTAPEVDPRFAPVVDAFAGDAEVTSGTMMSAFGLKVNGKIFAMVARGRLVAKLPKARVDEMVDAGQGERFDPGHGRRMKEWISVAAEDVDWVALAREAHHFVKTASR